MYLSTCFGVQTTDINNKNSIRSLSSLTTEDRKERDGKRLDKTASENPRDSNASMSLQHDLNLRNTAPKKYEFIRHTQLDLCNFYSHIKLHFVQFI